MIQRSLVVMKPDAVQRGVVGEILHRYEKAGLKIVGAKLMNADKKLTEKHYKKDEAWHKKIGEFNIRDCEEYNIDITEVFGTKDPVEIGKMVNEWLFNIFSVGPVFAFVLEGPGAVKKIRNLTGPTYPESAPPGTIRGDYGLDSGLSSLKRKRAILNLVHTSGTVEEAEYEIDMWFDENELLDYARLDHSIYSY